MAASSSDGGIVGGNGGALNYAGTGQFHSLRRARTCRGIISPEDPGRAAHAPAEHDPPPPPAPEGPAGKQLWAAKKSLSNLSEHLEEDEGAASMAPKQAKASARKPQRPLPAAPVAAKRVKRVISDSTGGFNSLEVLQEWPLNYMKLLPNAAASVLAANLHTGINLTTHFSGIGMSEGMACIVSAALAEDKARGSNIGPPKIKFLFASEINPDARAMLLAHTAPIKHIFGDLCLRWPPAAVQELRDIQQRIFSEIAALRTIAKQPKDPNDPNNKHPQEIIRAQAEINAKIASSLPAMRKALLPHSLQPRAWCYRCAQMCPTWDSCSAGEEEEDEPEEEDDAPIMVNFSTSMCVDFSSMGAQAKQSGATVIPFACWAEEMARKASEDKVDIIFHECTRNHPSEAAFGEYFNTQSGGKFMLFTFVLSPDNFGWPCTRLRRLTALISKRLVATMVPVPAPMDPFATKPPVPFHSLGGPIDVFGIPVACTAKIFYNASEVDIREHLSRAAKSARVPFTDLTSFEQCLCRGDFERLRIYLESTKAAEAEGRYQQCSIYNLHQEPDFMGKTGTILLPALLKQCGRLWLREAERWLIELETLTAMGFGGKCLMWPREISQTAKTYKFSGDGIHASVSGALFMWAIAGFNKATPSAVPTAISDQPEAKL